MSESFQETFRLLAIRPTHGAFGYVLFESNEKLVDWGLKIARHDTNARCIKLVEDLINRYTPDVILIEDFAIKRSRRRQRVKNLLARIVKLSAKREIQCKRVSRLTIKETFARFGSKTKYQIASTVATQLPDLDPLLPKPRKSWMTEDVRMSVFEAAAMALTFFAPKDKVDTNSSSSTKKSRTVNTRLNLQRDEGRTNLPALLFY
jgi:hypothetical protein